MSYRQNVRSQKPLFSATAIIQARMQSKRLPGKSLLPLAGKPLIAHVIERVKAVGGITSVVLATCPGDENIPLIECAESLGVHVFVGSESNVLERYYLAAEKFGGDFIMRVTGDNPFTDTEYATSALDIALESNADLSSISNLPLGAGVEVIKHSALTEAFEKATTPYQREHVTPYIKEHTEFFMIERYPVRMDLPYDNLRLTVDTPEDYEVARRIYEALYTGEPFTIKQTLDFLEQHPEIASLNSAVEQRPMTHSENE